MSASVWLRIVLVFLQVLGFYQDRRYRQNRRGYACHECAPQQEQTDHVHGAA